MDYIKLMIENEPRQLVELLRKHDNENIELKIPVAHMIRIIEDEIDSEEALNMLEKALEEIANGGDNPVGIATKVLAKYRGDE